MDIVGVIRTSPVIDLILIGVLAVAVILGVLQGAVRGIVSIGAILLAFLIAANSRNSVGNFLADNWTQFPPLYDRMLGFAIIFLVLSAVAIGLISFNVRRTEVYPQQPVVDDILGGLLGLIEGVALLTVVIVILGSYEFPERFPAEITWIRELKETLIDQSHVGGWIHSTLAPGLLHLLGALLPSDLVTDYL